MADIYAASPFHSFSEAMLSIFLAPHTTHYLGVQNLNHSIAFALVWVNESEP